MAVRTRVCLAVNYQGRLFWKYGLVLFVWFVLFLVWFWFVLLFFLSIKIRTRACSLPTESTGQIVKYLSCYSRNKYSHEPLQKRT